MNFHQKRFFFWNIICSCLSLLFWTITIALLALWIVEIFQEIDKYNQNNNYVITFLDQKSIYFFVFLALSVISNITIVGFAIYILVVVQNEVANTLRPKAITLAILELITLLPIIGIVMNILIIFFSWQIVLIIKKDVFKLPNQIIGRFDQS